VDTERSRSDRKDGKVARRTRSPIHSMRGDRMLGLCEAETLAFLGCVFLFFFTKEKTEKARRAQSFFFNHELFLETERSRRRKKGIFNHELHELFLETERGHRAEPK
jgi:hypothetical protein